MAKPVVGIGLTSYHDLSDPAVGGAVFDAYAATDARIVPNRIAVWSNSWTVANRDDFASHWLTVMPWESRERGARQASERGDMRVGAEWRRVGTLSGRGAATLRPDADPARPDTLTLTHAWSPRVDWLSLFRSLCAVCRPAHAMLHLFTEQEGTLLGADDRYQYFDRPITGEAEFTAWQTALGTWRKPDPWELEKRRDYRFLPQLYWANLLGGEFGDRPDRGFLSAHGHHVEQHDGALLFAVTDALADVEGDFESFRTARTALRHAFPPDTFRIGELPAS